MSADDVTQAVRTWAETHHLDRAHLERWLVLDADSAAAVFDAACRLRLRVGQLQGALEMLEEIALVELTQVSAVLARAPLKRILEGVGPAPARARAFVNELRAMRFPRLGRALERMKAEVVALKLPRMVAVALPKDLGSDELRIEIRVRSGTEFRESLRALAEKTESVERILDLLGGKNFSQ
ncbi:MAG TPA: hypothetical protein VNF28_06665 [Candidatus Binataceae bacterium]|nr:hypothetical protein [Candidatus Binataceae bacterium]